MAKWRNPKTRVYRLIGVGCALLVAVACGDMAGDMESADYDDDAYGYPQSGPTSEDDWPDYNEPAADAGVEEPFIPEEEEDYRFQAPTASRTYVFVANTDLNSVARIDSLTLQITTIEVGLEPTLVRTSAAGDVAVVLNEGSDDVSIIYADDSDRVATLDVLEGSNSLLLSPNGDFAMAYFNDDLAESTDQPGSLSEVTLIDLEDGTQAFNLVVGFHVREVEFDDAGETAFFITDDGIAAVDMTSVTQDMFVPPFAISLDLASDVEATDREVEVTGSGDYALVRTSNSTTLGLLDLSNGQIVELELGAIPTDLDLLPSGEQLVAVLRDINEVAVISIPEAFSDPEQVVHYDLGEETIGLAQQIPTTSELALFSTVGENDHLSILDLEAGTLETFSLRKGIESVHTSSDGNRLLIFHTKLPGEPVPGTDTFLSQSYAYTVFTLDTRQARLVITETAPGQFTFTEDGTSAFILLADEARDVSAVEWINLYTGHDQTIDLMRLPEAIGVIPATGRVYVSEEHEVGRMAFIDVETGEVREVTGYHLNSRTE